MINISVIVPLFNEDESLGELTAWIVKVMEENSFSYEILFVDDGSKDDSWSVIKKLAEGNPCIKGYSFKRNYGKSAALNIGFENALGDVVITMDADLQDSPDEIPVLYNRIIEDGCDLVSGWKKKRHDPLSKTIPSKFFNSIARRMTGIKLHDFNCGLKAYKNKLVKSIEVYGEMHRYIPIIAHRSGFTKIEEQVVEHRARKYGVTKFGLERFINGFLDLVSISFVSKFGKRPMHFFGTIGTITFFIGGMLAGWIGVKKMYLLLYKNILGAKVTENPYFYMALVLMIIGSQLFLTGFLAEMIARNSHDRNQYLIGDTTDSAK